MCNRDYGKGYKGNYAINIIDDMSTDAKIYKTPLFKGMFKLGSQHYANAAILGLQYAVDMPPDIRKSVSFVALGKEPNIDERRKLYNNFGGLAGNFDRFCDLMDQITGDYTFLIFSNRTSSTRLEDCVFWYRTRQIKSMWKFGCDEYRNHNKDYFDSTYVDDI